MCMHFLVHLPAMKFTCPTALHSTAVNFLQHKKVLLSQWPDEIAMVGVAVTASESETEEESASDFGGLGDSEEDSVASGSVCAKPAYGHRGQSNSCQCTPGNESTCNRACSGGVLKSPPTLSGHAPSQKGLRARTHRMLYVEWDKCRLIELCLPCIYQVWPHSHSLSRCSGRLF